MQIDEVTSDLITLCNITKGYLEAADKAWNRHETRAYIHCKQYDAYNTARASHERALAVLGKRILGLFGGSH